MKKNKAAIVTTASVPATQTTAAAAVDLSTLTPEALLALQKQLKALKKADAIDHDKWKAVVDELLHEKEGDGFKWTTSDILAAVQAKGVVKATLTVQERQEHIKRIQTRKQVLEKQRDDKGNLVHSVGYKQSANSFGPLDITKILAWMANPANMETVSVKQAEAIHGFIKHAI